MAIAFVLPAGNVEDVEYCTVYDTTGAPPAGCDHVRSISVRPAGSAGTTGVASTGVAGVGETVVGGVEVVALPAPAYLPCPPG